MMDDLNLTNERKDILNEFRKKVNDVLQPIHDDRFLLRILRARKFNLKDAETMLRNDVKFRLKVQPEKIPDPYKFAKEELKSYFSTAFLGFSDDGYLVRIFNFGGLDFKGLVRSISLTELIRYVLSVFEGDLRRLEDKNKTSTRYVEKTIVLVDLTGFKITHFTDRMTITAVSHIIKLYLDHYPERLQLVYYVNAPKYFTYVFSVFRPFLTDIQEKIHIFESDGWQEELSLKIPMEILPAYLGGRRYGPEDDPFCSDILNWNAKIPSSYYLKDHCYLRCNDLDVQEKIIRPRSTFQVKKYVPHAGMVLCWEFETKRHDISFGLCYTSKSANIEIETVITVERVNSDVLIEKSEFVCLQPGNYYFIFDNSHSWFRSKHLLYKINVQSSVESTSASS